MILITGATGRIGAAVVNQLLTKLPAAEIAALVRDPAKALDLQNAGVNIRIGDYDNRASLRAAMNGVDKVLLVSGGHAENGLEQHENVVDVAKEAGVKCIGYTSRSLRDPGTLANGLMLRHFHTEDYIRQSGLSYALFRNALYLDVLPMYVGSNVVQTGIRLPGGEVAFALRREMGEAIANVLAAGNCGNRIYSFTGERTYSFRDAAEAISSLTGRVVPYEYQGVDAYGQSMRERGLDPPFLPRMLDFLRDIESGQESIVSNDLAEALGRPPASLSAGLKELFALQNAPATVL